jgi:hypothetical protein
MSGRDALIVWGGWDGHEPERCARIVAAMLADEGFAVGIESTTEAFADPGTCDLGLIVPIVTMSTIEKEELDNLCAAIAGGVGLGGFHGGMGDAFRREPAYQFMCGSSGWRIPATSSTTASPPDDPIVAGIGDFDYRSEQYYMHIDPSNEVLATTTFSGAHRSWIEGVVMPVVWKRRYGEGRVFYSSLGQVAAEFEVPQMATILRRGLIWAAR